MDDETNKRTTRSKIEKHTGKAELKETLPVWYERRLKETLGTTEQ